MRLSLLKNKEVAVSSICVLPAAVPYFLSIPRSLIIVNLRPLLTQFRINKFFKFDIGLCSYETMAIYEKGGCRIDLNP